ncbi:Uncharacterised protein [Mycobacteroides abscessus]|nr:Uncharacterised protein [Mycobacteroides abscessus]
MEREPRTRRGADRDDAVHEEPPLGRGGAVGGVVVGPGPRVRLRGGLVELRPVVEDARGGAPERDGGVAVGRRGCEELAQRRGPAEPVEARDRAPGLRELVRTQAPAQVEPQAVHTARPLPTGHDLDAGAVHVGARGSDGLRVGERGQRHAAARVAAAAPPPVLELRVVERGAQERHAAPVGGLVVEHRLLLGRARGVDARIALGVVRPGLARRLPAALDAPDRAVDVEHLEHALEA